MSLLQQCLCSVFFLGEFDGEEAVNYRARPFFFLIVCGVFTVTESTAPELPLCTKRVCFSILHNNNLRNGNRPYSRGENDFGVWTVVDDVKAPGDGRPGAFAQEGPVRGLSGARIGRGVDVHPRGEGVAVDG